MPSSHQVILLLCDPSCFQSLTLICYLSTEFIRNDSIRDAYIAENQEFKICGSMFIIQLFIIQLFYSCLLQEVQVFSELFLYGKTMH